MAGVAIHLSIGWRFVGIEYVCGDVAHARPKLFSPHFIYLSFLFLNAQLVVCSMWPCDPLPPYVRDTESTQLLSTTNETSLRYLKSSWQRRSRSVCECVCIARNPEQNHHHSPLRSLRFGQNENGDWCGSLRTENGGWNRTTRGAPAMLCLILLHPSMPTARSTFYWPTILNIPGGE